MYNDGFNIAESDGDNNEFEFSKHYYERGAELDSAVAQLFSNWTDNFSTEFRISSLDLTNRQINIGDKDFGEVQIRTFANGTRATVYLGADDSRHTNQLNWDTLSFKLTGAYTIGDHTISAGWERDELEIFNLFVQETQGEFEFESLCGTANPDGCIDQFEAGNPDDIVYESGAGSNNPADAATLWGYEINTVYLQDQFLLMNGDLSIVAGVRYDWYTSDDFPVENQNFIARNGFTNATNFDGEGLVQPRLGFSWEASDNLVIRGGVGMYSGGNPNVWLSNNFSNNGILTAQADERDLTGGRLDQQAETLFTIATTSGDGPGGGSLPLWNVPQELFDEVANATGNFAVNGLEPGFEIPSAWKFALGATYHFDLPGGWGQGYTASIDFQHSVGEDDAIVRDGTLELIDTAPDGRPIYRNIDRSDQGDGITDFGCYTDGTYTMLDPTAATCSQRFFAADYILTNVKNGNSEQTTWSFGLSKSYDFGLDWTLAYTNTKSDDVSPMTSFVAFSNFANMALSDPENPGQARSNYEFSDRIILRLNYRKEFFSDLMTRVTLFGASNSGRPFSVTFDDCLFCFGDLISDRHLLYIPSGPSDPNVVFDPGFDQTAFFDYINASGLAAFGGGIAPRNFDKSDWWTKFDVKITQELPGFAPEHRFSAFIYIENFGNLLSDDWGVLNEASFPRYQGIVNADVSGAVYTFNEFFTPSPQGRAADASLWELRFGVNYSF